MLTFGCSISVDVLGSWCAGPDGYCRIICGPPPSYCKYYNSDTTSNRALGDTYYDEDDDCDDEKPSNGGNGPDYSVCEICIERPKPKPPSPKKPSGGKKNNYHSYSDDEYCDDVVPTPAPTDCDDEVSEHAAKSSYWGGTSGTSYSSRLWMVGVAAAVVAMVAAAVIMKKRVSGLKLIQLL